MKADVSLECAAPISDLGGQPVGYLHCTCCQVVECTHYHHIVTLSPLGRVMVSGPASFLASFGLLLLPVDLLPFALPLPLLLLAGAVARPEPAMPLADGADLLFLPIPLLLHLAQPFGASNSVVQRTSQAERPTAFDGRRFS